ncbi:MAG TPA: hypothetical protein VE687_13185 [Stellaceae bacterium]|nr:hypothetical protein [Stellaceae bacterium]
MYRSVVHFSDSRPLDGAELVPAPAILGALALFFGFVLFVRCPATLLHPEFWGEDGPIWYADAYTAGWHSLFFPQIGYLGTSSRLVALVAQGFPLLWAPGLFAIAALLIQSLTATFLVSARMSTVLPSLWGRLLLAFIYVALPNSFETHLNLTNAQWHLAILAFFVLVSRPAETRMGRTGDLVALALSGLSGPFCMFLMPIAIWQLRDERNAAQVERAAVVAITCMIQGSFLIATVGQTRSAAPLGASAITLARIAVVQIWLGGLLGARMMSRLAHLTPFNSDAAVIAMALGGLVLCAVGLWRGPPVLRKAALYGGLVLAAALWRPQVSLTEPQWPLMANLGVGQRYYLIPILVWIAVVLALAADRSRGLRYIGSVFALLLVAGVAADWSYPRLPATDFSAKAREFAFAAPGTRMAFPSQPPGFTPMILTKEAP